MKAGLRIQIQLLEAYSNGFFMMICSVADPDPGSGAFLTPGSGFLVETKIFIRP
jgi:hypothetical protein